MNAPLPVAKTAGPAEVELEFEVVIAPLGPLHLLSDDGRAALAELMEGAQAVAQAALAGARPPLPASLAARVQITIDRWDALARAERAAARSPVQDDALLGAHRAAKEAFEDAFNILISRFEKEFPRGSDQ